MKRRAERIERLRRLAKEGRVEQPAPVAAPQPRSRQEGLGDSPFGTPTFRSLQADRQKPRRAPVNLRNLRDRILLVIEVGALVGLVAILASTLLSLNELNKDVAEARDIPETLPTSTATALIRLIELPGAHAPPVPGQEPVPALYKDLISPQTPIPIPTPGPEQATRIVIPAIGVDAMVVEGDDWESLKKGGGHHIGSANPGERGNCVISAHDDIYGEIFRDIGNLEMDDEILVYAGPQPFRYRVVAKRIIEPTEVSVMDPTVEPVLTLITCYPYRIDTHRMIVVATLWR